MNSNHFLYAAYIVTWLIHIGYILYLTSRTRRLSQEIGDLERTSQRGTQDSR